MSEKIEKNKTIDDLISLVHDLAKNEVGKNKDCLKYIERILIDNYSIFNQWSFSSGPQKKAESERRYKL